MYAHWKMHSIKPVKNSCPQLVAVNGGHFSREKRYPNYWAFIRWRHQRTFFMRVQRAPDHVWFQNKYGRTGMKWKKCKMRMISSLCYYWLCTLYIDTILCCTGDRTTRPPLQTAVWGYGHCNSKRSWEGSVHLHQLPWLPHKMPISSWTWKRKLIFLFKLENYLLLA